MAVAQRGLPPEQLFEKRIPRKPVMGADVGEDRRKRSDPKFVMVRNRYVMLRRPIAGEPDMATGLPGNSVSESGERLGELSPGYIPGQLHAAMTSSRT